MLYSLSHLSFSLFQTHRFLEALRGLRVRFQLKLLRFNIFDSSLSNATARGKASLITRDASLQSGIQFSTLSHEQFGGRVLRWNGGVHTNPSLVNPSANPTGTTIGFTGQAATDGIGVSGNSFIISNDDAKYGFYFHNTGIHYFEATILSLNGNKALSNIGIGAPGARFFFNSGITSATLSGNGQIITSSGNFNVVYDMFPGQVLGFLANFVTRTLEIYVNGTLLTSIPNIGVSALTVPLFNCNTISALLNIGQRDFIYPQIGSPNWLA